ncbi:MAG: alpha/beta fold hydrolase [Ketobacter sp.]|nr:MAG: alpha/beta fold hydrolase [Ketobacter sp.]
MRNPGLLTRSYFFVRNAIERRTQTEKFIVSDKTSHDVLFSDGLMELRFYPQQDETPFVLDGDAIVPDQQQHRTPILLVPPLGVYHWIYDLMAERSWVRFLNARGFQVYLVCWGAPSKSDAGLSIDTYVNHWLSKAVEQVQEHSGQQQISMVGYCMGGLLTLLWAGAHDRGQIRNIVTIASPIDFHASHVYGKVLRWVKQSTRRVPIPEYFRDSQRFHVPGDILSVMFKMTNPLAGVVSYIDLVRNLSDRDYVTAHLTTREWFNNMPDYPGATVQQLIFDFGIKNSLADGSAMIGKHRSDLTSIRSNLLAFAGKSDNIVSVEAARKIMDLVNTEDRTFMEVPGGHAGVFAGGKAQEHTWTITADWLAQRSD